MRIPDSFRQEVLGWVLRKYKDHLVDLRGYVGEVVAKTKKINRNRFF